jgi:hypothetical protein
LYPRSQHAVVVGVLSADGACGVVAVARAARDAADACVRGAGVIDVYCPNYGVHALSFLSEEEQSRCEDAYQAACRAARKGVDDLLFAVLRATAAKAAFLAAFGDLRGDMGRELLSWADAGIERARDFAELWVLDVDPEELATQAEFLREVFGNPFRTEPVNPDWLLWNGGTVRTMAQRIYDRRSFADMPVLADALEEAGCSDPSILAHCRGPGRHVRGCHVLDLVLEKSSPDRWGHPG